MFFEGGAGGAWGAEAVGKETVEGENVTVLRDTGFDGAGKGSMCFLKLLEVSSFDRVIEFLLSGLAEEISGNRAGSIGLLNVIFRGSFF